MAKASWCVMAGKRKKVRCFSTKAKAKAAAKRRRKAGKRARVKHCGCA